MEPVALSLTISDGGDLFPGDLGEELVPLNLGDSGGGDFFSAALGGNLEDLGEEDFVESFLGRGGEEGFPISSSAFAGFFS